MHAPPQPGACYEGHLDVVRALRDWDVDIHVIDNAGNNAVHLAVLGRHLDVLLELESWDVDSECVWCGGVCMCVRTRARTRVCVRNLSPFHRSPPSSCSPSVHTLERAHARTRGSHA